MLITLKHEGPLITFGEHVQQLYCTVKKKKSEAVSLSFTTTFILLCPLNGGLNNSFPASIQCKNPQRCLLTQLTVSGEKEVCCILLGQPPYFVDLLLNLKTLQVVKLWLVALKCAVNVVLPSSLRLILTLDERQRKCDHTSWIGWVNSKHELGTKTESINITGYRTSN